MRGRDSGRDLPQEWIEFGVGNQLDSRGGGLGWANKEWASAALPRSSVPSSFPSLLPCNPYSYSAL